MIGTRSVVILSGIFGVSLVSLAYTDFLIKVWKLSFLVLPRPPIFAVLSLSTETMSLSRDR